MHRVELKAQNHKQFHKLFYWFLMHRVELKDISIVRLTHCGICLFLMHRVELKGGTYWKYRKWVLVLGS